MGADLRCIFRAEAFRGCKKLIDEFPCIIHRDPFRKIGSNKIKCRWNAVDRMLFYIKHSLGNFPGTAVNFLAPQRLFVFGEIFFAKNMPIKAESKKNRGYMQAWNAEKVGVKGMNLAEFQHFLVLRPVSCGEPEMIDFAAALVELSEAEHPLFSKPACMPETEFFDQHCKGTNPKIYEIKINSDF